MTSTFAGDERLGGALELVVEAERTEFFALIRVCPAPHDNVAETLYPWEIRGHVPNCAPAAVDPGRTASAPGSFRRVDSSRWNSRATYSSATKSGATSRPNALLNAESAGSTPSNAASRSLSKRDSFF